MDHDARLERLLGPERALWADGYLRVAGVDEAGVGPLAGPVVVAAAIFPPGIGLSGVDDSKKLTPARREALEVRIKETAVAWSVVAVEPEEIDRINIYQATLTGMRRAVLGLSLDPDFVLVDARQIPRLETPQDAIIKGDAHCHAIAAASILAKSERDRRMFRYDEEFPGYGFARHKGYPTVAHRAAIRELGACEIHRRSFTLLPAPRLFEP
ncbi:MAG: ribonuclease HII [Acidobacteriota bacterium]|nr:ribonuclease HII [Acidobacteriota bacterium]MDH3785324.1 ribonuclease HII [Acidobacteriota bacterium]